MNVEDVNKFLEEIKPDIKESIKKELTNSLSWDVKDQALKQIKECIKGFIESEVIPEVQKDLIENKEGLISVGKSAAPLIVEELAKGMAKSVAEKLESSYSRNDMLKGLFK